MKAAPILPLVLGALGVGVACTTSNPSTFSGPVDVTGAGSTGANGAGGSASSGDLGFGGNGAPASGSGGASSCAGVAQKASIVPLDMYIMLDRSGSMADTTGTGASKWAAVTGALETFFADTASEGLGAGIGYFPLDAKNAPESCTTHADCGAYGPCRLTVCSGDITSACGIDADCPGTAPCVPVGHCQGDTSQECIPVGSVCDNGGVCLGGGESTCDALDSCSDFEYAAPAVPIGLLNGAAAALTASISSWTPGGSTPTGAALAGAIQYAHAWAIQHPKRKTIVVLASDGRPTECTPHDTPSLAKLAANGKKGNPSVETFAIGVFAPGETAGQATLDAIAMAGGTDKAFLIDTTKDVNQAFLDALNTIRGAKLSCEYAVPAAPEGMTLDFTQVNVEHTAQGATTSETLFYVERASGCDPKTGGWYYDVNPKDGTPTEIVICPSSCSGFGLGGSVDIRLGCSTIIPPAK